MDVTGIHQKHQKLYVYICAYICTHALAPTPQTGSNLQNMLFCPAPKMEHSSFLYLYTTRFKGMASGNLIMKPWEESTKDRMPFSHATERREKF